MRMKWISIHCLYSAKLWTYDRTIVVLGMPCDGGGVGVEQVSGVGSSRLWVAIGLKDFADMLLSPLLCLAGKCTPCSPDKICNINV